MKAEKMVQINRAASREKVSRALREIDRMLEDEELVTIADLVERTGLSRAFFYNNKKVNQAVERARDLQQSRKFVKPQQVILRSGNGTADPVLKNIWEICRKKTPGL